MVKRILKNNEDIIKCDKNSYTYILECSDATFYTGWTNDLLKRVKDHNEKRGAKYTKNRLPAVLVYFEKSNTKQEAMKREYAIKQLTRKEKMELIKQGYKKNKKQIININKQINNNVEQKL